MICKNNQGLYSSKYTIDCDGNLIAMIINDQEDIFIA